MVPVMCWLPWRSVIRTILVPWYNAALGERASIICLNSSGWHITSDPPSCIANSFTLTISIGNTSYYVHFSNEGLVFFCQFISAVHSGVCVFRQTCGSEADFWDWFGPTCLNITHDGPSGGSANSIIVSPVSAEDKKKQSKIEFAILI